MKDNRYWHKCVKDQPYNGLITNLGFASSWKFTCKHLNLLLISKQYTNSLESYNSEHW